MERTPWFPMSSPPSRIGMYQFKFPSNGEIVYRYWDGAIWRHRKGGKTSRTEFVPGGRWRGLTAEAK